jgi:3-isopropylmalate/(R)-2-methylmalate dehydratase small subunit
MSTDIIRRGKCHVFGDDIPLDEGFIAFKYAIARVTDPELLIPHLFEQIDPEFRQRVKKGDIAVAGKNFGCGKAHMQGYIAMAALGMGVICESMPYRPMRGAIAKGVPLLTGCTGATQFVKTGDELEMNFTTGQAINHATGERTTFPGLPPVLNGILLNGGMLGTLSAWLDKHPDMRREGEGSGTAWMDGAPVKFMPREKA